MIKTTVFVTGLALLPAVAAFADDFTISTAETTTNSGNTVNAADTVTVTATGSVTTNASSALDGTGDSISLTNNGMISVYTPLNNTGHGINLTGDRGLIINSGSVLVFRERKRRNPTFGVGLSMTGNDGRITNDGTVEINLGNAIAYSGDNGLIRNNGTIVKGNASLTGNSGTILNYGTSAYSLVIRGDSGTIFASANASSSTINNFGNNGSITNYGASGQLRYTGDSGVVKNYWLNDGTFSTNRLDYTGDFGTVTNFGGIISNGGGVNGIFYNGSTGTITNNGTISILGNGRGMHYHGNFGTVVNTGTITGSASGYSMGASIFGEAGTLINSGSITTSAAYGGWGLHHDNGTSGTIKNSGSITTTGYQGFGIYHKSGNGFVTNSGSINTSGTYGHGIWHGYQNQITNGNLRNTGSIITAGNYSYGILNQGHNGSVTNRGTITTTGAGSFGILNDGDNGTVINTGSIMTSSYGIWNKGTNGSVINRGTITTTGTNSHGIVSNFANATVTNSGSISSPSFSIDMSGANGTLNLNAGSVLIGDVRFTNPATATLNFGRGLNAVVKLDSVASLPNTITAHRNAYKVVGDTIYVVNSDGFAARSQSVGALTGFVASRVSHHQQFGATGTSGTGASNTTRASTKGGDTGQDWFETFGGVRTGATSGDYSALTGGFVLGRDTSTGRGFFTGVGAGYSNSVSSSFTSRNNSLFAGGYFQADISGVAANMSLTAGVADVSGARTFGAQTASSRYSTYFFSPAITLTGNRAAGNSNLIFNLGARYTALLQTGYTETGSTANLTVGDISTHILELRAQATVEGAAQEWAKGTLFPSAYFGIEGQHYMGGAVSTAVAGSTLAFSSTGGTDAARVFAGLNAVFVKNNTSEVRGGFEVGFNSQNVASIGANIRWDIAF